MKRMIKFFTFAAIVAAFAVPALAQSKDCTEENKAAWYDTFLKNYKVESTQKVAYDAAKQYLACTSDPSDQYAAYLKRFVDAFDVLTGAQKIKQQFEDAFKEKKYADQLKFGKQILAKEPDSAPVNIILGLAGLGDANLLSDSAQYAKRAIEMIEAGKPFAPVATKDQALAYLNYVIAKATVANSPSDAIPLFVKAAKYESDLKKNALVYNELAAAYGAGPVAKLTEDYKKFIGQPESTESKLVLANLNQAIDRQIDAFARAAALSTNPADKKAIMEVLTGLYKDRNKSEAGLTELVASVLSKPLPEMPTPITSLPATSTPTGSPTNVGSPGTNGGAGSSGGAKTGSSSNTLTTGQTKTTSTSTTGAQTGSAKPAVSPTPKPKPRRSNHRVGI
jgi:hypothetical protein